MKNRDLETDFIAMIRQNEGLIAKVCRFYCKNAADLPDLHQEIVFRLWKGFQNFQSFSKSSTWIYRVAINTAIIYLRKNDKIPAFSEFSSVENEDVTTSENDETIEKLYELIAQLDEMERSIVFLYLDGKSHHEISEVVDCSVSNVGTKLQRIKEKLKKMNQKNNQSWNWKR